MLYNWFLGIYNIVYEKLYLVLVSGIQWFEKIGLILLNFKKKIFVFRIFFLVFEISFIKIIIKFIK